MLHLYLYLTFLINACKSVSILAMVCRYCTTAVKSIQLFNTAG